MKRLGNYNNNYPILILLKNRNAINKNKRIGKYQVMIVQSIFFKDYLFMRILSEDIDSTFLWINLYKICLNLCEINISINFVYNTLFAILNDTVF